MIRHKDMKMPFGQFEGQLVADLPNSYLNYLRDQDWFIARYKELYDQVVIEMMYREKFDIVVD